MIVALDGMELHYDVHGAGDPLLFLHGGMGLGSDWQFIFGSPPPGYRMIAPDLRGHGRSTGAGPIYSFRQSALDVFTLLDNLDIERARIVGISGGGITALHMAIIQPDRIAAMAVVSAPARFPEQARRIQRTYSEANLSREDLQRMKDRHPRKGQLETLFAQVRAFPDADDPDFSPEQLATIAADTLIVFGDRDPLYPVSAAVHLHETIPHSWLWVVPNGGHGPVFGAQGQAFSEALFAFFGGYHQK